MVRNNAFKPKMPLPQRNSTNDTTCNAMTDDYETHYKNVTPLFMFIQQSMWDQVIKTCIKYPEEASTWIFRYEDDDTGTVKWKRLPIHEACIQNANEGVINALLIAYHAGVSEKDGNGRLPLHHACVHSSSLAVIERLVYAYPNGVNVLDVWEESPRTAAESNASDAKQQIMYAMEKGIPYFIEKKEKDAWETMKQETIINTTNEKLVKQVRELQMKLESLNNENIDTNNTLKERDRTLKQETIINSINKELVKQVRELQMKVELLNNENIDMYMTLRERDHIMKQETTINTTNEELVKQVRELQMKAESLSNENIDMNKMLTERDNTILKLTNALELEKESFEQLVKQVRMLEMNLESLNNENIDMHKTLRERDQTISKLTNALELEKESFEQKMESLELFANKKHNELEVQNRYLQSTIELRDSEIFNLKKSLKKRDNASSVLEQKLRISFWKMRIKRTS